ncbi:MAG: hypothetical protein AAFN79_17690 [Pseudomonadota bacterium]
MLAIRLIASSCFLALASWAEAQELTIDPDGVYRAFSEEKGWAEPPVSVDGAFIDKIRAGYRSTAPAAVERLVAALETTYFGSEIGGLVAPGGAYSVTYLEKNQEIVLMRFFLNTVNATEDQGREWFSLVNEIMGDELSMSDEEILKRTWTVYSDPSKRDFEHGWISLSNIENRAMAWGVPPDFVEIVVSVRTDCEFLPVRGWLARQLCP